VFNAATIQPVIPTATTRNISLVVEILRMEKKNRNDAEWDSVWDVIFNLYVEQDKPLSEVMQAMEAQGFSRT
jgi:hypothetical protein